MATGTVQDWINNLVDYGLGDDILPDDLLDIINKVIQDVNTRMDWSYLQTTGTVTLTQGVAQVTLPARFNKSRGLVIDSVPMVLTPERRETILKRYAGSLTATGTPQFYYFIGQNMFVYPIPQQNYTAVIDYDQDEQVVTASTALASLLLPVKHQDVYFLGILARLYLLEDDTEMYQLFAGRFEKKIVDMMDDVTMHQYDMPERVIDVWDDGWGW
jgi:hypothetical protein